jgi:hemolysin-activating ACP:hemolysin acyltransferase
MWFTHCFAPFGDALRIRSLLRPLFDRASARYLCHRSNERGVRVFTFTGSRVAPNYARQWWSERPMLAINP